MKHQGYLDEAHVYRDLPFQANLHCVLEVREQRLSGDTVACTVLGWGAFRVFNDACVRRGAFMVPLLEGTPNAVRRCAARRVWHLCAVADRCPA